MLRAAALLLCVSHAALGFAPPAAPPRVGLARHAAPAREPFECEVDLEAGEPVRIQITPTMSDSELVVAQYPLPFFIDIENRAQLGAVVTKDGSERCGNQPVGQAGLEVLFTILAASTQRESAWRPRTRRLRLTHPNV